MTNKTYNIEGDHFGDLWGKWNNNIEVDLTLKKQNMNRWIESAGSAQGQVAVCDDPLFFMQAWDDLTRKVSVSL